MSIFVIVTSDNCIHCDTFKKQHMDKLLSNLSQINNLIVLNANFPERTTLGFFPNPGNSLITKKNVFHWYNKKDTNKLYINPKLEGLILGFPQFFLFSLKNWNSNEELNGLVPNGIITNGKITMNTIENKSSISNKSPVIIKTADSLTEWVKNSTIELNNKEKSRDYINVSNINPINSSINKDYMPKYVEPNRIKIRINPQPDE